jgi:iron complex outermembrane receptor protein
LNNKMLGKIFALGVASALVYSRPLSAQTASTETASHDTLQEVVVTAQRREENLQKVPIAVTAVSSEDMAASNVKSVQDLTTLVSGFIGPGNNGMQSPHLRGIGSQVGSPGIENSVALYVDGIYIGATTPALLGLNDVQQVEVLKGPQGTLFGRNTTGGLLQITTRNPSATPALEAELGYANYNATSASAYVNAPVNSNISTNLAVQASNQGEGWGKNLLSGKDVYRTDLNLTLRNKWDVRLGDATKFEFIGDYEKVNETGTFAYRPIKGSTVAVAPTTYTSTVSGWDVNSNSDQRNRTEAYGLAGRLSQDLGFGTLSDTLAFRHSKFDLLGFDADKTPLDYFTIDWHTLDKQWTNELQLASNGSGPLKWTAGVFYYHAVDDTFQPLNWGALAPVIPPFVAPIGQLQRVVLSDSIVTSSYAGYGQADYQILPATTLTAGLRYSHDNHSITGHNDTTGTGGFFPGPPIENSFSKNSEVWRLALSQQLSDDAMIYGSWNRGVKAGGYNPVVVSNAPYTDEQLDTFEAGSKLTFLDNRARLNLAGFYNKYKNIQVQKFQPGGPPIIYNGPAAKSYGLDVDFELRPVSELKIRGTLEALHSEFTDFSNADILIALATGGYMDTTGSATGNPLSFAPKLTASLAPTYTIPVSYGSYDLSGTWSYSSGFTTTPGLEVRQPAYNLLGASLQFTASANRYYVRFWASNLGNEQVAMNLTVSTTGTAVGLLAPRTFGVTVGAKFY